MAIGIEEIIKRIAGLPRQQRLALLRLLLALDRTETGEQIESVWDKEIRARVKAVDEGRPVAMSYEQIKKEMADRFPSR